MADADVIVVGAGVMGTSTARALARKRRDVLLLERFKIPHTRGSSHGASRIFRFSYADPKFVRMAREALPLWRELEEDTGEHLLTVTGGLDLGDALDRHAKALAAGGASFEWLDAYEVGRRFPQVSLPGDERALFHPDGGFLAADRTVIASAASARAHGAEIRESTRVLAVRPTVSGVEVETEERTYTAPVAVVTAGGWAKALLAGAGIELPVRVTRETVAYFNVADEAAIPSLVDWGSPAVYSLRSPGQGLKVGEHIAGPVVDPDSEGAPDQESIARLSGWVKMRYPEADPDPHLAETCLYTVTDDEDFIIDRRGPIVIGSPCSGHGFKFAPLTGKRLADLALERRAS
ncbi:MAG: N-methyl-L-tryptophan oxidase [Actinomycetota bacterium]